MERDLAADIPVRHVSAGIQQCLDDIWVAIGLCGEMKRSFSFFGAGHHIGTRFEKRLDGSHARALIVVSSHELESGVPVHRPFLGVRTRVHQDLDDATRPRSMIAASGHMKRGSIPCPEGRICPSFQQAADHR